MRLNGLRSMTDVQRLASHVRSIKRHIVLPSFMGDCQKLDDAADLLLAQATDLEQLRAAIRAHRDTRGDDRCWRDDATLYAVLPEGYTPPATDTAVELERCRQFIASRQHPATVYVSPQRRIEELEATALACHVCGKPAACIGRYGTDDAYSPACGTCCGHGNEDGWCRPVPEALAEMSRMLVEYEEQLQP